MEVPFRFEVDRWGIFACWDLSVSVFCLWVVGEGSPLGFGLARGGGLVLEGLFEALRGVLLVGEGVVVAAEEGEVLEDCFASVGPVDDVVDVAPVGGSAASAPGAVAVSGDDGSSLGWVDGPGFASDVDDF